MNRSSQSRWLGFVLAALLLVGLTLRLYNLNWDENHHVHPDERHITMVAQQTRLPDNLIDLLNPRRSPLNPYWNIAENHPQRFAYGSFPLYLLRLTTTAVSAAGTVIETLVAPSDGPDNGLLKLAREWHKANDYDHINLVGRALSAFFDTLTLGLVFLIGRRLYNATVGLLATALLTFTVQHIQLAHFYAFDIPTATVIVASVYFGIRVVQDGKLSDSFWLGALVALAIASKFSSLPLLGVIVMAHGLRPLLSHWNNDHAHVRPAGALGFVANPPLSFGPTFALAVNRALLGALLSLLVGCVVFAIVSPFTILDFKGYADSIGEQSEMVRGILDYPYTRQYRNTGLGYWFENYLTWALGWPLGIAALAGLALVSARCLRRTATPAELLMLTWVVPYALITLSFQVKFMRYLALITPFMVLMAAYLLWRIKDWRLQLGDRKPYPRLQSLIFNLCLWVVLLGALFYAAAFMSIYSEPLTRVQASEWIYRNIPAGKQLSDESWDDSLPLARVVDGRPRSQSEYKLPMATMQLHEPDDARKLDLLKRWIRQSDYIILSSNRMYGWIPRLADRFPIVNRYYELLFAQQLGFTLAAEFTSRPQLGGWEFDDDRADESFTVYDHPKVSIFQKTRNLSDAEFAALFADLPTAKQPDASNPATITRDKSLLLDRPVDQLPVVNDRAWNPLARASQGLAALSWWLALQVLGLLALPLTFAVFPQFADGGYAFSKALGLLLVAYIVWILASFQLIIQHAAALWGVTLVLLALALYVMARQRATFFGALRARAKLILIEEALFALAFLAFVGIRILNPDLWQPWQGGEKSMEFAFLNAILRSPYFPPYDPYFAGGYINYYYYGIYLVGALIKLSGLAPEIAFNLAIPTLYALTATGAFSVAYNLQSPTSNVQRPMSNPSISDTGAGDQRPITNYQLPITNLQARALVAGLLAALFITTLGNLDGLAQIAEGLGKVSGSDFKSNIVGVEGLVKAVQGVPAVLFDGRQLPLFDYWRSSRIVPNTINEFPYWSFLFADLHPHMIGIPFTLLAIALAAQLVLKTKDSRFKIQDSRFKIQNEAAATDAGGWSFSFQSSIFQSLIFGFVFSLVLGAIAAINTWDAPTYFGLGIGALVLRQYWSASWRDARRWLQTLIHMALIACMSVMLYWPFFSNYKALFVGLGLSDIQTDLQPFVKIWGFFVFIALTFIGGELTRRAQRSILSLSKDAPNNADHMVRQAHHAIRREVALPRALQLVARRFMRLPRLLDLQDTLDDSSAINGVLIGLLLLLIVSVALIALEQYLLAILLWPFSLSLLLLLRRALEPRVAFINWLTFWAFAILLGVEIVYLKDFLAGGEWKRMNTLFKFYIQVWVLLGIVAGVTLPELWQRISARRGVWPALWQSAVMLLLGASLIFPFLGAIARTNDRFPGARPPLGTLDGLAFMRVGAYTWPDEKSRIEMQYDLDAIQWLNERVVGTPVIAEAAIGYYREGGMRVASYTGLPSLLGMHQGEQRYSDDVGRRDGQAREFFNTRDSARAMQLIRELRISYIYLGQLEAVTYEAAGLAKFEQMEKAGALEVAYQNSRVKIYRVKS